MNIINEPSADILILINHWSTDIQQDLRLFFVRNQTMPMYIRVMMNNICFSHWVLNHTQLGTYAYAGWSTNGNAYIRATC